MKTPILFIPQVTAPGTERFFHDYQNPEKYGIRVSCLTPQHHKQGFNFTVRSKGKRYRGYVSSAGDCIVRLANQTKTQ